jgi:monoamine oxidase
VTELGAALASEPYDVVVVGAGVAGTAAAYLAIRRHPEWRCLLLEQSSRIGGRLLSLAWPGIEGVRAELGGMRFRTSQPLIGALVDDLGLATRPFRTVFSENRLALRGMQWQAGEPERASAAYGLADGERSMAPAELLARAFEQIVPGALAMTDPEWLEIKEHGTFRGRLLRDWTLQGALAAVLSPEGHRYVVDGFGYTNVLADRNAADAIPWVLIEARPEDENQTLVEGMESLPRALAARFVQAGGELHLDCAVSGVDLEGAEDAILVGTAADGRVWRARRLVLAVPPRALGELAGMSSLIDAGAWAQLVDSLHTSAAAKLFLAFERAWWRDAGFRGVRLVSDGPLSKTYAFDFGAPPDAPATSPALLLASYSDGPIRDGWAALRDTPEGTDAGDLAATDRWDAYPASGAQIARAREALGVLFPGHGVPAPIGAAFKDWLDGAWHTWNAGARSGAVTRLAARPVDGLALHLANEAWSISQGWVEGALEAAHAAVNRMA